METQSIIDAEFNVDRHITYLNHAAVSPWPLRTRTAVCEFATQNHRQGSLHYPQWLETESHLRKSIQALINAPSATDIALVKNTSEALSFVAYGLDWKPGDNVVISNQEFPSNRIVWESLHSKGVELRAANISPNDSRSPEQCIIDACDRHTRLVSVSSVQYASGLKMHLATIGDFCKSQDILFCVDAIQSVGAVNFDVQAVQADFAMADGHKWMLGPEGLGFFYCAGEARDALQLTQFGWHMIEDMGNFDASSWQLARSGRRFECGSPNMLGIHALQASVSLILQLGMDFIEQRVRRNTGLMLELVRNHDRLQLLSPAEEDRLAGIITFMHKDKSPHALFQDLTGKQIFCAERGGGIRLSPHFYTPREKIIDALDYAAS